MMPGSVLPRATAESVDKVHLAERHPGLQLDKLSAAGSQEEQGVSLDRVAQCAGDGALLGALLARREEALQGLGAVRLRGRTAGPLTLHLSRSGALENAGLALHPVYGFAWLPGSGIKGMARAWAETVWAPGEADSAAAWRKIREAFGTSPGPESRKAWVPKDIAPPAEPAAGRILFHDAWPVKWPRLERDIVNNHHAKYYAGEDDPGDWENPTIVSFLAVAAGTEFDFALSDRAPSSADGLAKLAMEWLRAALAHAGAGAKTNAGYGRIVPVEGARPAAPETRVHAEHRLELVSPAFLAGAGQGKADCDLRPATVRGLLRWWWRTMHADHLSRDDLREMETLVWGGASSGGAVSLTVEAEANGVAVEYIKRDIQRKHRLERPQRGGKVIQGLFYVSYGMDESGNRRRWYRDAGARWRLTLSARDAIRDEGGRIPARDVMEQAQAALWLLAWFGGAGSKSRKGFGSFADIEIHAIRSIAECLAAGQRFRKSVGLPAGRCADAPALDRLVGPAEFATCWKNPWYALDRVGGVYQEFVKSLRSGDERLTLGLPRRMGRPSRSLDAAGIERHASPALWSLSKKQNGTLSVRLAAFVAPRLPDEPTSRKALENLRRHAKRVLEDEERSGDAGPAAPGSPAPARGPELPTVGEQVRAILLEEKTKKGKWKARTADEAMVGDIMNSEAVPRDAEPGREESLFVRVAHRVNASFFWPTEEVMGKHSRPARPRGEPRNRRGSRQ